MGFKIWCQVSKFDVKLGVMVKNFKITTSRWLFFFLWSLKVFFWTNANNRCALAYLNFPSGSSESSISASAEGASYPENDIRTAKKLCNYIYNIYKSFLWSLILLWGGGLSCWLIQYYFASMIFRKRKTIKLSNITRSYFSASATQENCHSHSRYTLVLYPTQVVPWVQSLSIFLT